MTLVKTVVMIIRFCVLSISSKLLSLSRLLRDISVGTSPTGRWHVCFSGWGFMICSLSFGRIEISFDVALNC